ncbi:hypothetical protein GOBAR_AA36763 [Gossypium barbadense]|uniref:Uncharacterized protein n=1 Tax=Gossypium barbadense TaxID=3634 RepID=A0A2P5VYM3_GOSBA|nr:hypothetical protein GOBAR_AA36763 [Gossypium barbadense]
MLKKFISVSETRFQNTETTLKNQQASIQGLKTQIGQLAKLISERPQGSLSSNTESNPKEQLNEISSKNLHEPCSSNKKGPIYEERRLQIKELDEWRTHKPMTHDKPKPRHDEFNIAPNQLKSRQFIPNLTLLRFSNPHGQAHGRAFGRANTTRGDMAVRYGRVKIRYIMSNRGKKTTVPASKKRKGATSSSGPTAEIRHPFLQFPLGPQEDLFQIL